MALNDWKLRYDRDQNKWVWVDIRESDPLKDQYIRKKYRNLKNGFYPYEFNFLYYVKEAELSCSYCGIKLPSRKLTRDHIYPKSKGGCFTTPCCGLCNQAKGDMKPIEWALFYSERELDIAHAQQQQNTSSGGSGVVVAQLPSTQLVRVRFPSSAPMQL
jgi:5-methylcytosine-specific restriction endonuclease McrA